MRPLHYRRIRRQPLIEGQGARQHAAGLSGKALPPAQDQTAGLPSTVACRTADGQEHRNIGKSLREGGQCPAERESKTADSQRRRPDVTLLVEEKHLSSGKKEIAAPAAEGIADDLTACQYKKSRYDLNIARVTPAAPYRCGDLAVEQLDQPPSGQGDRAPSCLVGRP